MGLYELAVAIHLAGTLVLALFFVLLNREAPRAYLRDWTLAWAAQALALADLLVSSLRGWSAGLSAFLFLSATHGVLLVAAAQGYRRGLGFRRTHAFILLPVAVWSGWAPFLLRDPWRLQSSQCTMLAVLYALAAVVLWPRRGPHVMGLRLVTQVLALLAVLFAQYAAVFVLAAPTPRDPALYLELAPLVVLLLQLLLGLAMVLASAEEAQAALAERNAELREAHHRLQTLAETDPLTGCFNRRVFRQIVDELRGGDAESGVVLLLDMDGLKEINDTLGHAAGDAAIRRVADAIRAHLRSGDVVVRWGGDEFVVLLPGVDEAAGQSRHDSIVADLREAGLSASVGRSAYGPGRDVMAAVQEADSAMYQVKTARRGAAAPKAER